MSCLIESVSRPGESGRSDLTSKDRTRTPQSKAGHTAGPGSEAALTLRSGPPRLGHRWTCAVWMPGCVQAGEPAHTGERPGKALGGPGGPHACTGRGDWMAHRGRTVTEAGGGWGPHPMSGCSGWPGWIPAPRGPRKRPCHPHSQQHRVLSAVVAGRWCLVATLASWTDLSSMGHARVAPQDSLPVRYLLGRCPWVPWPRAADGAHAADSQHLSVQAGRPDGMAG